MADAKLSDLTALAAEMADTDEIYVNDGGVSKKQAYSVLKAAFATAAQGATADTAVQKDGSVALTANWDAGSFKITAETLGSDVATGTAPFTVSSTTAVTNLNADKVDGKDAADFVLAAQAAAAAEHGAGAIGTAATPATYRRTESGVIITQTKIDLTGLASVAVADDVIGLAAGGAAFIGRNVVATNGIIFKLELSCIETPVGGDNDVNVVANASAALAYDGAGGTSYLSNSGDLLAGQTIQNLVPALTANDYFYLTAGTGDTAGTYTAGQYILTTYGHALLA